ncbi:PTS sugar transporter subunit IIA [Pisciglobus halotolerans]|uniref:PTS system IIA component, Glc family n=1 Tax=Pisciglobus halotolerans TaxID=745365 RepID=A0A1I3BQG6_9LACT|nr:PTS glucose transporter subunit IIA [Pisciglobus halotolerans]SFH64558.1 PTS system IIA component, Glc family [Pisciglobus halotolerans]
MNRKEEEHRENKKMDNFHITAAADGEIIPITEVQDPVFSEKMAGEGFAINPVSDTVVAPISGKLYQVADSHHAYVIESADGFEVLVHIGINTISLNGEGFHTDLVSGMMIGKGEVLATFAREEMIEKGIDVTIPIVVVKGITELSECIYQYEKHAKAGKTVAMTIKRLEIA